MDLALYLPEAWTDDPDRAPASVRWKVEKSFAGSKDLAAHEWPKPNDEPPNSHDHEVWLKY